MLFIVINDQSALKVLLDKNSLKGRMMQWEKFLIKDMVSHLATWKGEHSGGLTYKGKGIC